MRELDPSKLVYRTFREVFGRDIAIRRVREVGEEQRIGFIPLETDLETLRQAAQEKGLQLTQVLPPSEKEAGAIHLLHKPQNAEESPELSIYDIRQIGLCVTDDTYEEFNEIFFGKREGQNG